MSPNTETLAMLGTGMIGGNMALRWLDQGHRVQVWNRSPAKLAALIEKGAHAFDSPKAAAAGASRVHLAVSDDNAVDEVLADLCAAKASLANNVLIVDHTTTAPAGTKARAAKLLEQELAFVHAPVFMSPAMCLSGAGLMLLAGPAPLRERVTPALRTMTGEVIDLGDREDAAAAYKLFGNAMIIALSAGLSDVFAIARANQFDPMEALGLFSKFSPTVNNPRSQRMAKGDFTPPSFTLAMARKDVRLMLASAGEAPLAVLPAIAERMDDLINQGYSEADLGVLAIGDSCK
jgi:3-hydroxyisobutyrate dehydrogenase-like beta-hydroxyacid dehydrogenase